jgi:hypothetical protein
MSSNPMPIPTVYDGQACKPRAVEASEAASLQAPGKPCSCQPLACGGARSEFLGLIVEGPLRNHQGFHLGPNAVQTSHLFHYYVVSSLSDKFGLLHEVLQPRYLRTMVPETWPQYLATKTNKDLLVAKVVLHKVEVG